MPTSTQRRRARRTISLATVTWLGLALAAACGGDDGGSSSGGAAGTPGCSEAPDCSSCVECYEVCVCNGASPEVCITTCAGNCGNGVKDGMEQCDGADLGGETCASATFNVSPGGNLACTPMTCNFNTSGCIGGGGSSGAGGMAGSGGFGGN